MNLKNRIVQGTCSSPIYIWCDTGTCANDDVIWKVIPNFHRWQVLIGSWWNDGLLEVGERTLHPNKGLVLNLTTRGPLT